MDDVAPENPGGSEQLVDVGGHRLLLRHAGVGWPVVVLDAGLGMTTTSPEWASVQRDVATFTHCCGYDRAGLGGSESGRSQRTSTQAVGELHALLHAAKIAGPYVLVGQSLGGLHAQLFAARYPAEVAGLVLVDATYEGHFDWLDRNLLSADALEEQRRFAAGANEEGIAFDTALATLQAAQWRFDGPLVVLIRDHVPPEEQPPEWSHEQEARLLMTWREVQTDVAARSPHGRLVVAEGSGHNIQQYRPDLIVEAIREVVAAVRATRDGEKTTDR